MIGELILELKGKASGVQVLSDGRTETSEQESGIILGMEATWLASTISTQMSNIVILGEGNSIITTIDGEVVMVRKIGIG